MNLSRTAAALISVLIILIIASACLWLWIGTGKPEVDSRIAGALQNFTCDKCGHSFALTMAEVGRMRRSRGQIFCPKCNEGGARKEVLNRPTSGKAEPTTAPSSTGERRGESDSRILPPRRVVEHIAAETMPLPSTAPAGDADDRRSASQ